MQPKLKTKYIYGENYVARKIHNVLLKINLQVGNENIMMQETIVENHHYNQVKANVGSHISRLSTTSLKSALAT
jgi:hypothetical protein